MEKFANKNSQNATEDSSVDFKKDLQKKPAYFSLKWQNTSKEEYFFRKMNCFF